MSNVVRIQSEVVQISQHGEGIFRVDLLVPKFQNRFLAGQFLHLTLEEFDPSLGFWPESRVFSIASAPKGELLTIVYSVKGVYTKRMEKELSPGRKVWLKYPYGDFIVKRRALPGSPSVFIAGGTGVAPFIPYLIEREKEAQLDPVFLFYGIRKPENFLFQDVLSHSKKAPWFSLEVSLETGNIPGFSTCPGRLSIEQIKVRLGDKFSSANYFLSGPPQMINVFKKALSDNNILVNQIHTDDWE